MMTRFITLLSLFLLIFASCSQRRKGNDAKDAQRVLYGAPVPVGHSDMVIIPVKLIDRKDIADAYYTDMQDFAQISDDAENLIFHNKKNSDNHLLSLSSFGKITFQFLETNFYEMAEKGKRFILYKVVKNDSNNDGKFDFDDATLLYISEESGKKFMPVTPDNTRLVDWVVEFGSPNLYVRYLSDSDDNGVFDLNDQIQIVRINLNEYYKKSKGQEENAVIKEKELRNFDSVLLKKEK
jgi:hypothetical protein